MELRPRDVGDLAVIDARRREMIVGRDPFLVVEQRRARGRGSLQHEMGGPRSAIVGATTHCDPIGIVAAVEREIRIPEHA